MLIVSPSLPQVNSSSSLAVTPTPTIALLEDGMVESNDIPTATLPTSTPNASPFLLKVHDVETLSQSDGFTILREHLAAHYHYE